MTKLSWIVMACLFFSLPCYAHSVWSIEGALGGIYNFPIPLNISQDGYPDIDLTARYETRPFKLPPYYMLRVGRWKNCKAFEVEFTHHKLYLINNPPSVKRFTITNGYNLLTFNYAHLLKYDFIFRFGLGITITHPESRIRDLKFNEKGGTLNNRGYYVSGPMAMLSLGRRFYLCKRLFFQLEGKLTAAIADVRIARGHAFAPNVALHGLCGIGIDL